MAMTLQDFLDFLEKLKQARLEKSDLPEEVRAIEAEFKKQLILSSNDLNTLSIPQNKILLSEKFISEVRAKLTSIKQALYKTKNVEYAFTPIEFSNAISFLKNSKIIRNEIVTHISDYIPEAEKAGELRADIKKYLNDVVSNEANKLLGLIKSDKATYKLFGLINNDEDPVSNETLSVIKKLLQVINQRLPFQAKDPEIKAKCFEHLFKRNLISDPKFLKKLNQIATNLSGEDAAIYAEIYQMALSHIENNFYRNGIVPGLIELALAAKKVNAVNHAEIESLIKSIEEIYSAQFSPSQPNAAQRLNEKIKQVQIGISRIKQNANDPTALGLMEIILNNASTKVKLAHEITEALTARSKPKEKIAYVNLDGNFAKNGMIESLVNQFKQYDEVVLLTKADNVSPDIVNWLHAIGILKVKSIPKVDVLTFNYGSEGGQAFLFDDKKENLDAVLNSSARYKPIPYIVLGSAKEYFPTKIPDDEELLFEKKSAAPVYTKLVAYFIWMQKQLDETFTKEGRSKNQTYSVLNFQLTRIIDELTKFPNPDRWVQIKPFLNNLVKADSKKKLDSLVDDNIKLGNLLKALNGNLTNTKAKQFIDGAMREEKTLGRDIIKASLKELKIRTTGEWYVEKLMTPGIDSLQKIFSIARNQNLNEKDHALENSVKQFAAFKAHLRELEFDDNALKFEVAVTTKFINATEFTIYDYFKLGACANFFTEKSDAIKAGQFESADKRIKELEKNIGAKTLSLDKAIKDMQSTPSEGLQAIIKKLSQEISNTKIVLEKENKNKIQAQTDHLFYSEIAALFSRLKAEVGEKFIDKGVFPDSGITKNNSYPKLADYLIKNVPIEDIPKKVKELFVHDNLRNEFNIQFYQYQLDHALEIIDANKAPIQAKLKATIERYTEQERALKASGASRYNDLNNSGVETRNRYQERLRSPEENAQNRANAELKQELNERVDKVCEQFILNLIELIKETDWGVKFGGEKRPGIPHRLPTNVAAIYDKCIEARNDPKKRWSMHFEQIIYMGMVAAKSSSKGILGFGKRSDVTKNFYTKFDNLWRKAEDKKAVEKKDVNIEESVGNKKGNFGPTGGS